MEEPKNQRYELWESASEGSDSFFPANSQRARETLAPDARLIWVVEAASWNEAQQKRYDFMGCGHYRTIEEEEAEPPKT